MTQLLAVSSQNSNSEAQVSESCFRRDLDIAGQRTNYFADDLDELMSVVTADTRMWGFQVCIDPDTEKLTSFRL